MPKLYRGAGEVVQEEKEVEFFPASPILFIAGLLSVAPCVGFISFGPTNLIRWTKIR
jgi:hypothetical protein